MKRNVRNYIAIIVLIIVQNLILVGSGITINASSVSFGEFSVRAVTPENQIDKKQTYFDLRMKPGQKQTVQLYIRNGSKEAITAYIKLNPASTSRNGVISYNSSDRIDESLAVSINDIAVLKQDSIEIAPDGEGLVDIDLKMPAESFDGTILGGFVVTAEPKVAEETEKNSEGVMIENLYSYTVGIKITETDTVVGPDFHLKSITPGLVNYSTSLIINLQNSEAAIVKGMKIDAKIYKKGSDDVFRKLNIDSAEVAPNSNFDVVVDWENSRLETGTYRLKMRAEHEDREWVWDEEFTIDPKTSDDANKEAVNIEKPNNQMYILYIILALLIVAIISYLLGKKNIKKQSTNKED